jgi:hypothetical protein
MKIFVLTLVETYKLTNDQSWAVGNRYRYNALATFSGQWAEGK